MRYFAALALFVLAMLSKSSAFSLPFVLAILAYWKYPKPLFRWIPSLAPFFVVGAVIAWWDVSLVQRREVIEHGLTWTDRLIVAGKAFWFYPMKVLVPTDFAAVYPKWEVESFSSMHLLWPLSVLLFGVLLVGLAWRGWTAPLIAFLIYSVLLGPTLGFVDFGFMALSFVADRFAYLAVISLFALVVAGLSWAIERSGRQGFWRGVAGLILGLLVLLSAIQCRVYEDQETLVRHNLKTFPEAWIVRYNFAIDLASLERYEEAVEQYQRVIQDRPGFIDARNNLGTLWVRLGFPARAEIQFREILKIDPENARALQNLGALAARGGRPRDALELYRRSLALDQENEAVQKAVSEILARLEAQSETDDPR